MRDVAFMGDDVFDQSFVVEDDLGFRQIEVNRSAPTAPGVEDRKQLAHQLEHRDESLVARDGLVVRSVRIALTAV